jgi:CelD/BcsL family acetyltransferase involved in cellulose biosynthesis
MKCYNYPSSFVALPRKSDLDISLAKIADFAALEMVWRDLEPRAEGSFFQSWFWTGCLLEERFPDPVLLTVRADGRIVGLGLFNSHRPKIFGRSTLWLGESGNRQFDDIFIEHNGFLLDRSQPKRLLSACLRIARQGAMEGMRPLRGRLIMLSGVGDEYIAATRANRSRVRVLASRSAPFVDLVTIRQSHKDFLGSTSSNTRYQLRRSERRYAENGPITVHRAKNLDEAQDFLSGLTRLHQNYWIRRGKPGAFANPLFERFHQTLISRAFASGGVDLLRVTTGDNVIGYLYNLIWRGHVCAYQSGFNYDLSHPHQKPGLTCHHVAIEMYLADGANRYDFLAGPQQYKISLSSDSVNINWLRV